MNVYIGIDNGSTGSIGIIGNKEIFFPTPVIELPNYQKNGDTINRIDIRGIKRLLTEYGCTPGEDVNVKCLVERPFMAPVTTVDYTEFVDLKTYNLFLDRVRRELMDQGHGNTTIDKVLFPLQLPSFVESKKKVPTCNMTFLKASLNAHRSFEATIILLEAMKIGYEVVDSKAWQKVLLGASVKGSKALKQASKAKGIQMFPHLESVIKKHGDADGLMLAEFCRRYYTQ